MSKLLTISVATELSGTEIDSVLRLVADAEAADQIRALNEAALLRLRRTHPTTRHVLVGEQDELVGYAQLESGAEWSASQLVVSPDHRREGVGTRLLQRLIMESTGPLRIWAIGDSAAAQALAATAGMDPTARAADHGTGTR